MQRISIDELKQQKFGKLIIVRELEQGAKYRRRILCKCDCGNEAVVHLTNLRRGHTTSCGCLLKEWIVENKTIHNLRKHPLYRTWTGIKSRCSNSNASHFEHYGGRGIKVCNEWKNSFEIFYKWSIINGWEKGLEIDRIDNDGNYEPNNCRWVTHQTNCQNRIRRVA